MKKSPAMIRLIGVLVFLALLVAMALGDVSARAVNQRDALWQDVSASSLLQTGERSLQVRSGRYLSLNLSVMHSVLGEAPSEYDSDRDSRLVILEMPMPDGSNQRFGVFESPIMAPELAARYPQIKTYAAQGVDDPTISARLDITPQGFHAIFFTQQGTINIDPLIQQNSAYYVSYYRADYLPRTGDIFYEPQMNELAESMVQSLPGLETPTRVAASVGTQLRTYRLALAATGEYTDYHGGTVELALAAQVVAMNRVNGIYEREVALRMVLIPNNDQIIYTDGATDPYTNEDGFKMLTENQENLDEVIGTANYDIGHVFSTGGGGIAMLRSPCNDRYKAQGVTGLTNPIGDAFYVDYVAHEMGHQWGGNHTYNGDEGACASGRSQLAAYEPGSASTIMGYAGICGEQDLQQHSDAYFHPISFDEIVNYTTNGDGNTCAVITETGNLPPSITSGTGGYYIPINTPFTLSGTATDPDGDFLTYAWDEMDLGKAGPPPPLDGYVVPPYFRSFTPTEDATRTFPRMSDVVNNTNTIGEILPLVKETLDFRFTVRDNRAGGGGVNFAMYVINVADTAGPFLVTSPDTAVEWAGGSQQIVTWNVANTNAAPVNCSEVSIVLSTDGGYTYPFSILASTPNDGSELITVPSISFTDAARVRVACLNHIFFDISNVDFSVKTPDLAVQKSHVGDLLPSKTLTYTLEITNQGWLTTEGIITVEDTLPSGLEVVELVGGGWSCDPIKVMCTRSDPLPVGGAYPSITLVVIVLPDVHESVINEVRVLGGADADLSNNVDIDFAGAWFSLFMPTIHR